MACHAAATRTGSLVPTAWVSTATSSTARPTVPLHRSCGDGGWRLEGHSCTAASAAVVCLAGSFSASRRRTAYRSRSCTLVPLRATKFRALTKIRLRELPDVNAKPTGAVLEANEIFEIIEMVKPPTNMDQGYMRVSQKNGWAFHIGIAGDWAGRPIIERVGNDVVTGQAGNNAETPSKPKARKKGPSVVDAEEVVEDEKGPESPRELDVLQLLSWSRSQADMIVHPGIAVKGSHLITSMPVTEGTPLVGVMPKLVLEDTTSTTELEGLLKEAAQPEDWSLRLALLLLHQRLDDSSSWWPYLRSLPPRPATPLLWSDRLLEELQDKDLQARLQSSRERLESFATDGTCLQGLPGAEILRHACAASERAIDIGGRHLLIPLIDLVGPVEGQGEPASTPACRIVAEGEGDDIAYVLYASRDLEAGEPLTRDVGLSREELLLSHGLAGEVGEEGDKIKVVASLPDGMATEWQLKAIRKSLRLRAGKLQGDYEFAGELCRADTLEEAVSESLLHAARVLSCTKEVEVEVYVGDPGQVSEIVGDSRGLVGLYGNRRDAALQRLLQLVRGSRGCFPTTLEEDLGRLDGIQGCQRVATAYRAARKSVVDDVLSLLEDLRKEPQQEGALPFAVTGIKP